MVIPVVQFVSRVRSMARKLAIVAGGGRLPWLLRESCQLTGREYIFLAVEGEVRSNCPFVPDKWIRLGQWGANLDFLRSKQIKEIVFAGTIKKPNLKELQLDSRGAAFMTRLGFSWLGADSILSTVLKELESEGFDVISPDSLLTDILSKEGAYGKVLPSKEDMRDIQRGINVIKKIGELDIGQAVVIQDGIVIGVEAIEGTDEMLRRCKILLDAKKSGVLVKFSKPGQERRIDLPTIGIKTIEIASESGIKGIAIEAGGALVINSKDVSRIADELGLFVFGVKRKLV